MPVIDIFLNGNFFIKITEGHKGKLSTWSEYIHICDEWTDITDKINDTIADIISQYDEKVYPMRYTCRDHTKNIISFDVEQSWKTFFKFDCPYISINVNINIMPGNWLKVKPKYGLHKYIYEEPDEIEDYTNSSDSEYTDDSSED